MWLSNSEQLRTGEVDWYTTLSVILAKALERDATMVNLGDFLDVSVNVITYSSITLSRMMPYEAMSLRVLQMT